MNSVEQLERLESHSSHTFLYVLAIVAILLVAVYIYKLNKACEKPKSVKIMDAPASAEVKELVDTADSLKTSTNPTLDAAADEGDIDSGVSATLESELNSAEMA